MILGKDDSAAAEHRSTLNELFRRDGDALTVSRPPAGTAAVGGYRSRKSAIEAVVAGVDPEAIISALLARGGNPPVAAAFCPRGEASAAALTGY
jgi:hypothetical protein